MKNKFNLLSDIEKEYISQAAIDYETGNHLIRNWDLFMKTHGKEWTEGYVEFYNTNIRPTINISGSEKLKDHKLNQIADYFAYCLNGPE